MYQKFKFAVGFIVVLVASVIVAANVVIVVVVLLLALYIYLLGDCGVCFNFVLLSFKGEVGRD